MQSRTQKVSDNMITEGGGQVSGIWAEVAELGF